MPRFPTAVLLIPLTLATFQQGIPYIYDKEEGALITKLFLDRLGEKPKMAWLVPPNLVLAGEKHSAIYLYSSSARVQAASYVGLITAEQLIQLRREFHVACDQLDQTEYAPFHKYQAPHIRADEPQRAFYTSKPFPGRVAAGFTKGELNNRVLENTALLFQFESPEPLHRFFTVATYDGNFTFSFHGFYNPSTRELFKRTVILHEGEGEIRAHYSWDVNEGTLCDGCARPTYDDELRAEFAVLNIFAFPGFPYPVLLLDTGTFEGRAISFATFDDAGAYAEYRLYEYVVNCILGDN